MAAGAIEGIQSERVIATLKHYAANNAETNRHWQNLVIDPAAMRESELLGFQIAVERSQPGAMMCGYNKATATMPAATRSCSATC